MTRWVLLLAFAFLCFFAAPASAQTSPCFACPTVTETTPKAQEEQEGDAPAPQVPKTSKEVDSRSRSQNFVTGEIKPGRFDPAEHNLWYMERDETINVPIFSDPHVPNLSDMLWGQISDGAFTGYKYMIDTTISIVGGLVFGFMFIQWLLEPALKLAHAFQEHITEPFGLGAFAIALAAGYAAYLLFAKRKPGQALAEYWMSASILAVSLMFVPLPMIRYLISAVSGFATVILLVGTGQNPKGVAAPSTGPVDTTRLVDAYHQFVGSLENIMIGTTAEVLTFGSKLPRECIPAYKKGQELGLNASNPDNFKFLAEIEKCQPYVNQALQPDALRAGAALGLIVYGIAFCGAYLYLSWPAVRGQIQLMFFAAVHKFLFIGAALPGAWRARAVQMLIGIGLGLAALVVLSVYLALMLSLMTALFAATGGLPMAWRLIAALAIPIALCVFRWKKRRSGKEISKHLTEKITRTSSERSAPKSKAAQLVERAQSRVVEVGAGAVTGATSVVVAKGANRLRRNDQVENAKTKAAAEATKTGDKPAETPSTEAPVTKSKPYDHRAEPNQAVGSVKEDLAAARAEPITRDPALDPAPTPAPKVEDPVAPPPPVPPPAEPTAPPASRANTLAQDMAEERARRQVEPTERPQPVAP